MRIEGTYKTPIHGISTLAPRNRADGQAELQVNLRSDPVQKLTRRPSLVYKEYLQTAFYTADKMKYHEYTKDGQLFRIILNTDNGFINCYKGSTVSLASTVGQFYLPNGDIEMKTIENTTYVLNKNKIVTMSTAVDASTPKTTHINVTSALNYGESVSIGIGSTGDFPKVLITYSVPDLTVDLDYDTADKARATSAVAEGIATLLNATTAFNVLYKAATTGSSVLIAHKTLDEWVPVYIETGQGDRSVKLFSETIEETEGLPLFAHHGTRVTVKPNPISDKGTFYLQAERVNDAAVSPPTEFYAEECVWVETRSGTEPYKIDELTLPLRIEYDLDTDAFTISQTGWKERRTGDDESCPAPEFVGERLVDIGHFQNRLVVASKGMVFMTETDDYDNWWKASALKLLVSDPVSIGSSAVDTENIERITNHNRDLMLISPNGQFKIDGNVAVTPQSVSMPKVSSFECVIGVPPVSMGTSVRIAINQGQSAGVLDYTTRAATEQERGDNISKHIVGLLKGTITKMVGSVNSDILVAMSDLGGTNTLYVFEQFDDRGKIMQNSWSTWEFPTDIEVIDLIFKESKLRVITNHGGVISEYEIDLYSRVVSDVDEIFLDYFVALQSTDGLSVDLPTNYPVHADLICVRGTDSEFELFPAKFTKAGDTITFDEPLTTGTACTVYMGVPITARYIPTRPFRRTESGQVITTDRVRVARWHLNVVDTHEVTMRIDSDYVQLDDQNFQGRVVGRTNNIIGEKTAYTGDVTFSYSQDAGLAKVEFRTEGYLGLTIAGISWDGQYYKTSGRI
tara:strand:+ start:1268 stop:3661 length:2394 start_codon:yes stop_codon:yes gene_type:complete